MDPASSQQLVLDTSSLAQLTSSDTKALLDTVDSLRQLGVGDFVDLPQIIVVGDQSSGKSSVLEAISRVRFPVDGDLCTRFATELVLRRADVTEVKVTIQFAEEPESSVNSASQRGASQQPFQRQSFDKDALPEIIKEAKELMGIRKGGTKKFSKDILRVEIARPGVYPLTLVDLPGIFHSATADQDLDGKKVVDQLIESYMKQPKSIILAVVAANNQLANQMVLQQARKFDPTKERTIGVITKPDLAGPGSSNERKYLDLAKGRESVHKLALGWYVLRNRSEEERTSEVDERDDNEERFFQTGAWSSISPTNRGIESLRKRLSKVLLDHIKTSLPDLVRQIEVRLRACQEDLDRLGDSRSTPSELRSYLHGIAEDFQSLARDAIEGRYGDKFFGTIDENDKNALKLRAVLRNLNRAFYAIMQTKGARYEIFWDEDYDDYSQEADGNFDDDDDGSLDERLARFPDYLQEYIDFYDVPEPEPITESALNVRLRSQAAFTQGKELPGMPSGELVLQFFKDQAKRWPEVAQAHLDQVLERTEEFVVKGFDYLIGADETTADAIWRGCVQPFFHEKKDVLRVKLQELLLPYINARSLPPERDFLAIVSKKTLQRLAKRLADQLEEQHPELFQPNAKKPLTRTQIQRAILNRTESKTSEFGTEKALDMMVAYYEVSVRTFKDNVVNLAVENCLIADVPNILTGRKVDAMTVDELRELASESEETQMNRSRLQDEVRILREGLRKCRKHKPKESTAQFRHSTSELAPPASNTGTPSRSPTPLGDPAPSPAAVPAEPPQASSTRPLFGSNAAPTGAFGSGGLFGKGTSSTTPMFGSSQSISNSPAPGPSLFGQRSSFNAPSSFSYGSLSSGNGQAAGVNGTFPTPSPPGTGLFSNLASRPGSQPLSQPTGASSLFGSTAPSSTKKSNTNTNTNKNNTDSGDRNDRGSDDHLPAANLNSTLKKLRYSGMDTIPVVEGPDFGLYLFHSEPIPCWKTGQPSLSRESYVHLCSAEALKSFSPEELRLKWVVSRAD